MMPVFRLDAPLHEPQELLVPEDNEFTEIIEVGRWALLMVSPEVEPMKELRNLGAAGVVFDW